MKNYKIIILMFIILLSILAGCNTNQFLASDSNSSSAFPSSQKSITSSASTSIVNSSSAASETRLMNIQMINKAYIYQDTTNNMKIELIAENLIKQMLDDLSHPDNNYRTFYITDYKDIKVGIKSYLDQDWKQYYPELNENVWYLDGSVNIKFSGLFSPIGDAKNVPQDMFLEVTLGQWFIVKDGNSYKLISIPIYKNGITSNNP